MKIWSVSVLLIVLSLRGFEAFSFSKRVPNITNNRERNVTPLFAGNEGFVKITDVEAELIARKLRGEIIDFPMIPNFMEKVVVEQILKAILEVGPVVLPKNVFNRLIAGEGGADSCTYMNWNQFECTL